MTTTWHRRAAFTLIEMIVVIGIILLLLALNAGAIFRVRETQLEKTTNESLRKIQMGLDGQWKAATDQIRSEKNPPQAIVDLTRNANGQYNPVRAHALHTKLRLRQEFPQSF